MRFGPSKTLALYAALLPFETVVTTPLGGTLARYVGAVAGIHMLLQMLLRPSRVGRVSWPLVWTTCFVILATLSVFWSIEPQWTAAKLTSLWQLFLLYLVMMLYRPTNKELQQVMTGAVVGGILASLAGLWLFWQGFTFFGWGRLTLVGTDEMPADPNVIGVSLLLSFLIGLHRLISSHRWASWLLPTMCMGLAIVLTGSRGALLAVAGGSAVLFFALNRRNRLSFAVVVTVIVLLIAPAITLPQAEPVRERLSVEAVLESRASERFIIWQVVWGRIKERPLFGYGYEAGLFDLATFFGRPRAQHNIYLQAFMELGLPGVVVLIGSLISHLVVAWRGVTAGSRTAPLALATVIGMMIAGGSLGVLLHKFFWFTLGLAWGASQSAEAGGGGRSR